MGDRGLPREGGGRKVRPLGFGGREPGMSPGILLGCPGPLRVRQVGDGMGGGRISDFSSRPWRNLPPTWVIHMATRRQAPHHADPPQSSFPCLFGLPCLFPFQGIPCDFERFSLLSQGFSGFDKQKKSLPFWWFSLLFSKEARQRRSGHMVFLYGFL